MLLLATLLLLAAAAAGDKTNIVYIQMDDTDVLLGGAASLSRTIELVGNKGATFTHALTLSPKCTPSRAGQLAGRHYHNVRPTPRKPKGTGRGLNKTTMFQEDAMFPLLHGAGYWTSIVGKVHNGQANWLCNPKDNKTWPFTHISTECSPCGGYWRNPWTVKEIGEDTTALQNINLTDWSGYSEGQYSNRTTKFIRDAVKAGKPFFAYLGTTGPHLPAIPAPWHLRRTNTWNKTAPRTPNFNGHYPDHHPIIAGLGAIREEDLPLSDKLYSDRLGALLSIDDLVAKVVGALEETGVLDNTLIIVSADHGYHIGQWRLPEEKMWPYETDIRIPLWIRGPGIAAGQVLDVMAMNLDYEPTMLDFAGIAIPETLDGKSLRPLITGSEASRAASSETWRTKTVISFAEGEEQDWGHTGMANATVANPQGTRTGPPTAANGQLYYFDNAPNQWRSMRVANSTHNVTYVEWDPLFLFEDIAFHALYDMARDPFQEKNLWASLPAGEQAQWHEELAEMFECHGQHGKSSDCP